MRSAAATVNPMAGSSAQLRAVGTAFLLKRPIIVAPGIVGGATLLSLAGVPHQQLMLLGPAMGTMFSLFCVEAWIGRRRPVSEGWLAWSLGITVTALALMCAMSGGLRSPFVPLTLAPVVVAFAAFGRRSPSATMAGYFVVLIGGLATIPNGWPWPPIPTPYATAMTAVTSMIALALAYVGVAQLSATLASAREAVLQGREEALLATTDRLRSLETIGSKVAHELKNPLASIKGLAQLSARGPEDSRTHERFKVLLAAARRMEDVLEEYLSFSRPLHDLALEPVDLDTLVNDAIELVELRAKAAGVAIDRSGRAGVVPADRRRLFEALLNLLTNAIEASAAQGRIRVVLARGDKASVDVIDQGQGLSETQLQRLGTPYFTTKAHGTGLGVVVAMAAVRQHGGDLRFDSGAGRGTHATIDLPLRIQNPDGKEDDDDAECAGGG